MMILAFFEGVEDLSVEQLIPEPYVKTLAITASQRDRGSM